MRQARKIKSFFWVPDRSGIKGHKEDNILTRKGARPPLTGPEPFCGIRKNTYKREFLQKEKAERETLWQNSDYRRKSVTEDISQKLPAMMVEFI